MGDTYLRNAGDVINGSYKILEPIGHGAMGEVYVATDSKHGEKELALKYLKLIPGKATALEQFKSEFALLTHLSHPNIARVFDFEQDEGSRMFFYTTELIKGADFVNALMASGVELIEEMFVQTLRALEYLHGNGIFHFDIKSANVLVTSPAAGGSLVPTVKLIDFGLATIRFQGKLVGTPSYMAPEMVKKENPDGRSDLYSLGVLIYSTLTKINPFRTQVVDDTLKNQLTLTPFPPSAANPNVPQYLDRIVMRLLEKDPKDRYQTAAEVIRDLNLMSPKRYSVETEETQSSYIPFGSKFIGRKKELGILEAVFSEKGAAFIAVRGGTGSGRTRFLAEARHIAQVCEFATVSLDQSSTDLCELEKAAASTSARRLFVSVDDLDLLLAKPFGARLNDLCEKLALSAMLMISAAPGFETKAPIKLDLENFTPEEIKDYLAVITGMANPPAGILETLYSNTGGNPFIVTEVVKSLVASGALVDSQGRWQNTTFDDIKIDLNRLAISDEVKKRMLASYLDLPAEAKPVADILAVAGRPMTAEAVESAADVPNAHGLLLMLVRRGILKFNVAEDSYYFLRPLLTKAVYDSLPERDRALLHDKLARLPVAADPSGAKRSTAGHDAQLFHLSRGSDAAKAKAALEELIDRQIKANSNRDAIGNIIYYLSKWDDPTFKIRLARLYVLTGKYALAVDTARNASSAGNQGAANEALQIIGTAYLRQNDFGEARKYFSAALKDASGPDKLILENFLAEVLFFEGKLDAAISIYERTAGEAKKLPHEEQFKIRNNNLGNAYFQRSFYEKAVERLLADIALFKETDNRRMLARLRYTLAESYRLQRLFDKAAENFNALVDYARATGDLEHLFRAYNGLGNVYNDQEKWPDAAAFYKRALDVSLRLGMEEHAITCIANLGLISSNAGNMKEAVEHFLSALSYIEGSKVKSGLIEQLHCRIHLELGEAYRLESRFDEARRHLAESLTLAQNPANTEFNFWIKLTQLKLARETKDDSSAKTLLAECRSLADTKDKKEKLKDM